LNSLQFALKLSFRPWTVWFPCSHWSPLSGEKS